MIDFVGTRNSTFSPHSKVFYPLRTWKVFYPLDWPNIKHTHTFYEENSYTTSQSSLHLLFQKSKTQIVNQFSHHFSNLFHECKCPKNIINKLHKIDCDLAFFTQREVMTYPINPQSRISNSLGRFFFFPTSDFEIDDRFWVRRKPFLRKYYFSWLSLDDSCQQKLFQRKKNRPREFDFRGWGFIW